MWMVSFSNHPPLQCLMGNVHVIGTGGTIASRSDVGSVVADSAGEVLMPPRWV